MLGRATIPVLASAALTGCYSMEDYEYPAERIEEALRAVPALAGD